MTTATETKLQYRKTRKGEWVVYGPADHIETQRRKGLGVTVTKRSGETKLVMLSGVGRRFAVDGVEMVYGYIDNADTARVNGGPRRHTGQCSECRRQLAAWEIRDYGTVCHDCF